MDENLDSKYSLNITDELGNLIIELSGRAKNRQIQLERNGVYEASWELDLDDLESVARSLNVNTRSLLTIGKNEVIIKRQGVDFFGGKISYYEAKLETAKTLTLKALGWFALFKDRFSGPSDVYTAIDQGAIAWDQIDDSQQAANGDFGITQGVIQASRTRNRTYEYKSVQDILTKLSEVDDGIDFEFTPDKRFNVFYPHMGVTRNEFQFTYPGNIKSIQITTDASEIVNYAIARGQGFGEGQIIDIIQDTPSQAVFKRREQIMDFSEVVDVTHLQELAAEEIRIKKDPIEILEIELDGGLEPIIGSYWLGDRVKVIVEDIALYEHIDAFYRIDKITIDIDDNDVETVTLRLTI